MASASFDLNRFEIVKFDPANPAAGAIGGFTVPLNTVVQILSCNFALVTDATVADRYPFVAVNQGGDVMASAVPGIAHPASTSRNYKIAIGLQDPVEIAAIAFILAPLFTDTLIPPGWTISIPVVNIQATDQIGNQVFMCKQWIVS